MAVDTGLEAFKRQEAALIGRPDNRPLLADHPLSDARAGGPGGCADTGRPSTARSPTAIPGARLEIIPDCGHLSTLEQPEAVNRALRAWLTQ